MQERLAIQATAVPEATGTGSSGVQVGGTTISLHHDDAWTCFCIQVAPEATGTSDDAVQVWGGKALAVRRSCNRGGFSCPNKKFQQH
jgi:hypothetical protein